MRGFDPLAHGSHIIADDPDLDWPKRVLHRVQAFAVESGFYVSQMMPRLHSYHLDDAPDLKSCNLMISSVPNGCVPEAGGSINDPVQLAHFYGASKSPHVHYVRERERMDYGKANETEYELELLDERGERNDGDR